MNMRLINYLRYLGSKIHVSFKLSQGMRQRLLGGALTLIYFLLLTPIAWLKRVNPKNPVASWRGAENRGGWIVQPQSTTQKEIYRSLL